MGRSNHDTPCEKREPQKSLGQALHSVRARKVFQLRLRSVKVDNQRILRSQQMANIILP